MISYSNLGKPGHGRLGNQLFQIASTMGIAERNGVPATFPVWKYEQYFELIPHGVMSTNTIKEKRFEFDSYDLQDADLQGWFQSEKYFGSKIPKLKNVVRETNTIAISIRRGDYIGNPNYYEIPIHWYISALTSIENWQQHKILFFSDDIEYCRVHFECLPNAEFCGGTDIEQLQRMAGCEKHIIANSTFSWWGAYLSESNHVMHSGRLFAGRLAEINTGADFYPAKWIRHEGTKIDLKDVTFTIPVMKDSNDRKQNLDLSLCFLQRSFDTNIEVMEQGGNHFEYVKQWVKYSTTDSGVFHRTKMLNDMAKAATTPILVNFDCDILIPPMQMLMAVEMIRNGGEFVYPYDGRFARVGRVEWFKKLELRLDIGIVGGTKFKGKYGNPMPVSSVGGVIVMSKDVFIESGMENENFISYGPEDCERYDRWNILQMKVERVKGAVYHLDHWCGPDSSKRNPYIQQNEAELYKIRAMDKSTLMDYIDTWQWCDKYTAAYYKRINEGSERSAKAMFEALVKIGVKPLSVFDVGCGCGAWVQDGIEWVGLDNGVSNDKIYDGVLYLDIDLNNYLKIRKHETKVCDLLICMEVAEHIEPDNAVALVDYLCRLSDTVLFSAAIPYQGGTGHVNEQWQSWWSELFKANGFGAAKVQPDIRQNKDIEMWYRQNTVLYVKGGKGKVVDFVLPEYYEQCLRNALNK